MIFRKGRSVIFRKGQMGQILVSPFVIGLIILMMVVFVFLSATVFKISSGATSGKIEGVSSFGLGFENEGDNELLFREFGFGELKSEMFVVEAVILRFNGDLELNDFEDGLEDLFKELEEERSREKESEKSGEKEYCLGFAYNSREGNLWRTKTSRERDFSKSLASYSEIYNSILLQRKGGIGGVEFVIYPWGGFIGHLNLKEIPVVNVKIIHNGKKIFISYFYDDCSRVFVDE